jgi:ZIP family zinc transporter
MDVINILSAVHPVIQALCATIFTWGVTAVGAAMVFFFKSLDRRLLDAMLGFAGGVMIAASFWSLLAPSIELAEQQGLPAWLPAVTGFLAGGVFLRVVDRLLPHLHIGEPREKAEGPATTWKKSVLLILAITLHNIPEGLAVGVAFGAAAAGVPGATLGGAVALAVGIGLQNFPEGAAVSVPLRREGLGRLKSFFYGQLSGIVEPMAGVLGAAVVLSMRSLLPFALSFAAGAMIFVVVEEVIPESQSSGNTHLATLGAMLGFSLMMLLDVALG